jgi:uncharacterized protein (TIGR03083 family)
MANRAVIEQLSEVWASIGALGRELDEEDWSKPTDCPGWTVKDHLAHIVGTESVLAGRPSPPPAPSGAPHVRNRIGELNEAWVEAMRPLPGPKVLEAFVSVTGERLRALERMSDAELEAPTPSPIGEVPYATFMEVRVMDCVVHEQDMRSATGRPGHLEGPAVEAALDRLGSALGFVVARRASAPEGSRVVVALSGPVVRSYAVEVREGRGVAVEAPSEPTVRVVMDSRTFLRLAAGRAGADEVEGLVAVEGDEELGRRVLGQLDVVP